MQSGILFPLTPPLPFFRNMKRFVKCFFELLTQNTPFCSLGDVRGAGAEPEPPQNLPAAAAIVGTDLGRRLLIIIEHGIIFLGANR